MHYVLYKILLQYTLYIKIQFETQWAYLLDGRSRKFALTRDKNSTIWLVNALILLVSIVTRQNKSITPPHQ